MNNRNYRNHYTLQAEEILKELSLSEKLDMMTGCANLDKVREVWLQTKSISYYAYPMNGIERFDVPSLTFSDGPKGMVCGFRQSTCFPAPICRGASFDPLLEQEIGSAIGEEARAYGVSIFGGVCVNLPYNPGWGRMQEVFGEDSFALGTFAAALVRGVQREGVIACIKHFAFNSMENMRAHIDISCDRRSEREVFLPHFKACIDAGAACVMGAFNRYLGEYCCQNEYLLRTVLKGEWQFDGFVISDWFTGIHDTISGVTGGCDVEMPVPEHYGEELAVMVRSGQISEDYIDDSVLRIIRTALALQEFRQNISKDYPKELIGCSQHTSLALTSAREGITLLKNEGPVLPLRRRSIKKIAVIGKLAKLPCLGDHGSSQVFPSYTVSPLMGICNALPQSEVIYYDGCDIRHASSIARTSDAVIFVVGNGHDTEGESLSASTNPDFGHPLGGDRKSLYLNDYDTKLLVEAAPLNKNSIAVLIGGGTFIVKPWIDSVKAVLMAYYPGQEGGTALADIIFGKVNPGGKLPFVIPYHEDDLPKVDWDASSQFYGYYHGYRMLDKNCVRPHFPYGFGLSYTSFSFSDFSFSSDGCVVYAGCTVENTGNVAGSEVIQLYAGFSRSSLDRPVRTLCGFQRVNLKPHTSRSVIVSCPVEQLKYYDESSGTFKLEHMQYELYLGNCNDPRHLVSGTVTL